MRVKIVSCCSQGVWYDDKVGFEYDVKEATDLSEECYFTTNCHAGIYGGLPLLKEDCEVVDFYTEDGAILLDYCEVVELIKPEKGNCETDLKIKSIQQKIREIGPDVSLTIHGDSINFWYCDLEYETDIDNVNKVLDAL